MRIGIDFDSTITKYPSFFSNLTRGENNECFVITARPEKEREYVEGFLKNHDIKVVRVMMITEDLAKADDRAYIETVFREKPRMCREEKIEVMYDDDLRILRRIKDDIPNMVIVLVL